MLVIDLTSMDKSGHFTTQYIIHNVNAIHSICNTFNISELITYHIILCHWLADLFYFMIFYKLIVNFIFFHIYFSGLDHVLLLFNLCLDRLLFLWYNAPSWWQREVCYVDILYIRLAFFVSLHFINNRRGTITIMEEMLNFKPGLRRNATWCDDSWLAK